MKLTPLIEGRDAGETLVFIQGWPDDASLWDRCVAALRDEYRCVRMTMPNYGGDRTARWGYTTPEITSALETHIAEAGRGKPVTLILHDWGCYWGYAVHNRRPDLVSRLVGLDVAPHFRPSGIAGTLGFVSYQWWLLGAFVVGGPVGDWMTRSFAKRAHAPADPARVTAWMNYPYRNSWADLLSGRVRKLDDDYWPTCPLLFVYGEKKPFPFHTPAWLEHVRKAGGEVVALPCDHWVTRDPSFTDLLVRWLHK